QAMSLALLAFRRLLQLARILLANLSLDRESLRLEGRSGFCRQQELEELARLGLRGSSQCDRIQNPRMAILRKSTHDFDGWFGLCIGPVDDAKRRLSARNEDERRADIFRLSHARRHLIPYTKIGQRSLAVLPGRHGIDARHG